MKKVYTQPVTKVIDVDDNFLTAQSTDPNFVDLYFDLTTEQEGSAE